VKDELDARGIKLRSFLETIQMKPERWNALLAGSEGPILSELQRMAGALGLRTEFLANLNIAYRKWRENDYAE
jgi:plasmid maintenance system antidote protein VapI